MKINWHYITGALQHYRSRGYTEYTVPYTVSQEAYKVTQPEGTADLYVPEWDSYLAASGEQSFIDQMLSGVQYQNAMCVTPCFRAEPVFDRLHKPHFMKLELLSTTKNLWEVIEDARSFFYQSVPDGRLLYIKPTDQGYDIQYGDTEIGSYGVRQYKDFSWVYGTGVAEPRLTTALEIVRGY